MKLFFGKIGDYDPNQLIEGYYQSPRDSTWFNGIDIGDYAYIIGGNKIQLWKAANWGRMPDDQEDRLNFDILFNDLQIEIKDLVSIKYFKLTVELIVKTVRSTAKEYKAFFPIDFDPSFSEEVLLDPNTYSDQSNYRNIVLANSIKDIDENSLDIHLYFENKNLKLFPIKYSDSQLEKKFRDNLGFLGKGQPGKDKVLAVFKAESNIGRSLGDTISKLDLYDAFMCEYKVKELETDYWVVNGFESEKIEYCLANNVFVMQFQYDEQQVGQVTNHLKLAAQIREGDKVLLYNNNHYYGHGTFTKSLITTTKQITLKDQITSRIRNQPGDLVEYTDAPCYYEDLRKENGFKGAFGQRLAIASWKDVHSEGIEIPGIAQHVKYTRNTILKLPDHTFYNKVTAMLAGQEGNNRSENNTKMDHKPLNQILYGPPGTGKTYKSIKLAVEIANPEFEIDQEWDVLKQEYDRLVEKGKIVFTTFHQSMNYEDFVEGIKPQKPSQNGGQVWYKVENGIFKLICENARYDCKSGNLNKRIIDAAESLEENKEKLTRQEFEKRYNHFAATLPAKGEGTIGIELRTKSDKVPFYLTRNSTGSISVKAKNGKSDMSLSLNELLAVYFDHKMPIYKSYIPVVINELEKGEIDQISPPITPLNPINNYVLIIDEINRGNVSAIFGELITLIEENKRACEKEAISVELPYSKELFDVPNNLYIIGTMNTADRSVEALDTALRRRFSFTEMPPDPELIKNAGNKAFEIDLNGYKVDLVRVLTTINNRLEILLDKDHLIGHSFFMKVEDEKTLRLAFRKEIIPLMQEYFYGDYGKISLVLGEGFCKGEKVNSNPNDVFSKGLEDYDAGSFLEKTIYTILDPPDLGNAFRQLLNDPR